MGKKSMTNRIHRLRKQQGRKRRKWSSGSVTNIDYSEYQKRQKHSIKLVFTTTDSTNTAFYVSHDYFDIDVIQLENSRWQATMQVKLKKIKRKKIQAQGATYEAAIKRLFHKPLSKTKSTFQKYAVTYDFVMMTPAPKQLDATPKTPKSKTTQASQKLKPKRNRYAKGYSSRPQTTKASKQRLAENCFILGDCKHGIPEEECPKCASWGSDWSQVREHD